MRFQPTTHCQRGHEFTPENTQLINVSRAGGTTKRGRLCRICSRARLKRYRDNHPKKAKPVSPVPDGSDVAALELELYIRRILRFRLAERAPEFWLEVESRLEHHRFQAACEPHRVPIRMLALTMESWPKYAARTNAGWDDYGDWFVNRMLDDPRIRATLKKVRSQYIVIDPGDEKTGGASVRSEIQSRGRDSIRVAVSVVRPYTRVRAARRSNLSSRS